MLEMSEIRKNDDGSWVAANGQIGMTVASGESRLFKRRAMRPFTAAGAQHETYLVGELEGVRTYIIEREGQFHILVTKDDLYPEFV